MLIIHLFKIIGIKLFHKKHRTGCQNLTFDYLNIGRLLLHFRLLHFRLRQSNRKCNNRKCNTFNKTCIKEGLGQNRLDGVWRREGESVTCELLVYYT